MQGNIVLTSLAGLGLAPLGDYGGPTQTIALLPGSPALGAGTALNGITTDQRGEPLDVPVDIGAFQSQGFVLAAAPGTTPQSAPTGEAFANPLAVTVSAGTPSSRWSAASCRSPSPRDDDSGAGAVLSARNRGHRGRPSCPGHRHRQRPRRDLHRHGVDRRRPHSAPDHPHESPEQLVALNFSGLSDGASSSAPTTVTFTGTLASATQAPPPGETVAITLGGVTHQAVIGPGGAFTATFDTAGLNVAGSPYTDHLPVHQRRHLRLRTGRPAADGDAGRRRR